MKHQTEFPRRVIEHEDMGIVMPDGVRLSARVWLPEDAEANPVPVILEHLPYRKRDGTIVRDQFTHPWMAGHGYACIRTDIRGSGESEGLLDDEYTAQELQDACDVIAWAASQPWCNGKVGMQGISWGGFNALQVASMAPPALKAIITICSTVDRYADDIHYKGGCLLLENFGWSTNILSYDSRPPDPEIVGEKWTDIWRHRLENQPLMWSTWFRHQHRDAYWKHGSVCEDYSAIKAAVLSIGGWHDGYRNTISHLVEHLDVPVKGIVGPWNHKYPHYAGPRPAIGFLQEAKRWWDRWLKDEATNVEADPAYRAYLMESLPPKRWFDERPGKWIAETEWPSPDITAQRMHFNTTGGLDDREQTNLNMAVSSKQNCGMASGEYFPFAFGAELPDEQSGDDALSLCFDSDAYDATTDIVGAPQVSLQLAADRPNAQIAVRICDLRPDGTSALITMGCFNLTHHRNHDNPEPLAPGTPINVAFALDQIAYRVPAGHRLRVAVSTSYWPFIWPSPRSAEITLHHGHIDIPLRATSAESGDEWQFEEPVGASAWRAETLRETSYNRTTETDETTGVTTTQISCDNGECRDLEHGLISGSWFKEQFFIHSDDPLSARAAAQWEQTGGRDGQMWRTSVDAEMTSDATHFHTRATLQAFLNGGLFFERTYKDSVIRDLV